MASPLPTYIHDEVFRMMNTAFQELPFYEKVIEPKMMKLISDADRVVMDHKVHKRLTERYYDVAEFNKTEQGKLMLTQIHIAVRACYVLIMTYHESKQDLMWRDVQQLLAAYPEFHGQDEQELRYLLQFRNMLRLALEIVPPRLNKKLLINIAARLEGSGREYITGGGQKPCVTRRVLIYEREGNVQAEKRDERPRRPAATSASVESGDDVSESTTLTGKKRTQLNPSMKKLKMIRLDSHEAKQYIRTTVPLPSNALLTLSRECSKHLMQTDGDEAVASVSSVARADEASTALDDLLMFQPAPAPSLASTAAASSSFLVPPFQASSGTFAIPVSVSRSSSAASLAPSHAPSSSTKAQTSIRRDFSDFSFHFPPGLLSRQHSELLSSLASSCHGGQHAEMAWLAAWDAVVADQQNQDPAAVAPAHHHHHHNHHDGSPPASATSVVLPMLRAVSWDAIENGSFAEDLVRVLATF